MPSDIDNIVDAFPYPVISQIQGPPSFATIKDIHIKLNANAASIHSNLGDGNLGYIYLTVTNEVYNTLSDVSFIEPANPGMLPVIPTTASVRQANDIQMNFKENRRIFNEYTMTDKALKQQLLSSINDIYIKALKHPISAYSKVTTKEILAHLYDRYGQLTPQDLKTNDDNMNKAYDPNTPIENLFEQIEQAVDIASTAEAPYNATQIVNVAYTLIFNTNAFPETCREWRRLPQVEKTWNNFKTIFTEAHKDYMMMQTQNNHRFHAANVTEDQHDPPPMMDNQTKEALANLASATAADRTALANLTATNERLTAHIELLTQQLTIAIGKISTLEAGNNQPTATARRNRPCQQTHYCWSHGFRVNKDGSHTSKTCTKRRPGHQENATSSNRMGGYEYGLLRQD